MSNAPSFGKTRFLSLLLVGAVACFAACQSPEPPPVACTEPTFDEVVNISLKGGQLEIDHDYVFLQVNDCEQVVWTSAAITDFTVSLEHDREFRPDSAVPPPNPFTRSHPGATFTVTTSNGTISSGLALEAARGHLYKFTITATVNGELLTLDPHVVFDWGGGSS